MSLFENNHTLLQAFKRGDLAVLEQVYLHYVDLIAHILRCGYVLKDGRVLMGVPQQDFHDLLHEVFARAFAPQARQAYNGLTPYRAYLLSICKNCMIDRLRKHHQHTDIELAQQDLDIDVVHDTHQHDAEHALIDQQTKKIVNNYIEQLSPEQKTVYNLLYNECLSQRDAAEKSGLSRQTIRTLEHKIKAGLAHALKKAGVS